MTQNYKEKEGILGKDLLQDSTGDIIFDNNDLVVTVGTQGVVQRLLNKLKSFFQSLFAHPLWGGFFQGLVSKNMSSSLVNEARSRGIQEFTEEPEVLEVKRFNVTAHPHVHLLEVDSQVQFVTDLDIENIKSTLNVEF